MRGLLLALVLAGPASAQEVDCANAMAQVELTFCAEQDWMAADARLNAVYRLAVAAMKQVDAGLPRDQRGAEEALRRAQRAWIAYRDAACEAEGWPMHGGSAEAMLIYGCRARLTEDRSRDLGYLAGEG